MQATVKFGVAALIGKSDADRIAETLTELHEHLVNRGLRVIVETASVPFVRGATPESGSLAELGERCDFAVVVG